MTTEITTRDILIYFATVMALSLAIAALAYPVIGWLGYHGEQRVLIATQIPVALLLLIWIAVGIAKT